MSTEVPTLWALFLSSFLASTLLPGGSEVILVSFIYQGKFDPLELLFVATAGNTLGGMSTWTVGRFFDWWYPSENFTQSKYQHALNWLKRWGSPALVLSWIPVLGDPICLLGGWLRIHWSAALFWIGLGKASRYVVIVYVVT